MAVAKIRLTSQVDLALEDLLVGISDLETADLEQFLQNHYLSLAKKLHEEVISPTEHKELLELIDIIEAQKVERLKNLIELSQLRNVSLDSLMEELNLNYYG